VYTLVIKMGKREIENVPCSEPITIIGRSQAADVTIENISVSGKHAEIRVEDDQYILTDLGSTNGTFRNQQRVKQVTLQDGDEIQLGKVSVEFLLSSG